MSQPRIINANNKTQSETIAILTQSGSMHVHPVLFFEDQSAVNGRLIYVLV